MNINEAFSVPHIQKNVYSGNIKYNTKCIYCLHLKSNPLLEDGSFRKCLKCLKHFKAQIIANPILNYNESLK